MSINSHCASDIAALTSYLYNSLLSPYRLKKLLHKNPQILANVFWGIRLTRVRRLLSSDATTNLDKTQGMSLRFPLPVDKTMGKRSRLFLKIFMGKNIIKFPNKITLKPITACKCHW